MKVYSYKFMKVDRFSDSGVSDQDPYHFPGSGSKFGWIRHPKGNFSYPGSGSVSKLNGSTTNFYI